MSHPRVTGLAGFGLEVPDLDEAARFYGTFGLATERRGPILGARCAGRGHDEIILVAGVEKRLHHISFAIRPEDERAFAERLGAAGVTVEASPIAGERAGIWFRDPWNTWVHLMADASPAPPAPTPRQTAGRIDRHLWRELDRDPRPVKLGHMLVYTQDFARAEAWYDDMLGVRASDRAVGKVAFMAAGSGVIDHHCFGFINSTHRGFQHASFQMRDMDDIAMAVWRMRKAGYTGEFGPGRHALASNLFHYLRDPWGSWIEYYADMDKISDAWTTGDWNELPYVWGPAWSPEFWGGDMNANREPR